MWKSIVLFVFVFSLAACADNSTDINPNSSQLVVEGWIEDGGFPVVILGRQLLVSRDWQFIDSLSDYLVRWAKVTISDGTESVVLTGKYDKRYFPPYIYTTGRMRGEAGKTYALTVEYRDFQATATTTIPHPLDHCTFNVVRCTGSDSLFQIKAHFTDNPVEKNYYQFFSRVGTDVKQYLASYLGSIDDEVLVGETEVSVFRGHQLRNTDYTPYYFLSDTVSVKIAQVDEVSFRFWDSYTKMMSLSKMMFLSTSSNLESNIVGGYGYWCGYGAITSHIVIRDSVENNEH